MYSLNLNVDHINNGEVKNLNEKEFDFICVEEINSLIETEESKEKLKYMLKNSRFKESLKLKKGAQVILTYNLPSHGLVK